MASLHRCPGQGLWRGREASGPQSDKSQIVTISLFHDVSMTYISICYIYMFQCVSICFMSLCISSLFQRKSDWMYWMRFLIAKGFKFSQGLAEVCLCEMWQTLTVKIVWFLGEDGEVRG